MITLTEGNPTLRENWVPLSQPPASREDPGMARAGAGGPRGWPAGPVHRPFQARPESALSSGPGRAQRGRLTAKGRGLVKRKDRFIAAGGPRQGW